MIGVYRLLMRLYPRDYRTRFESEMLEVLGANAAAARRKGRIERGLLVVHEVVGLLLGVLRERQASITTAKWASSISHIGTPFGVLALYVLSTGTMVDLGLHALFSPISYGVLLGGVLLGLWAVSSQRTSSARLRRAGLILLTLFFWLGLPYALSVLERSYQAGLRDHPVEFLYRYPGGAIQAMIAGPSDNQKLEGRTASETIALADHRSLVLVMRSDHGAPAYRILIPACLMGISFLWRRRLSS